MAAKKKTAKKAARKSATKKAAPKKKATKAKATKAKATKKKASKKKATKARRKKVRAVPKGQEDVIPHLTVDGAREAIAFYRKAFGAKLILKMEMPGDDPRLLHAEIAIGKQVIFLADDFPEFGPPRSPKALGGSPITLSQYVENCDKAIAKAVRAGATVTMPAMDMFWGDRYGKVLDPFGHEWAFATHIADLTPAELKKAAKAAMDCPPPE